MAQMMNAFEVVRAITLKACDIAVAFKRNGLVDSTAQKKSAEEANPRFGAEDVKTLVDVLIQEMATFEATSHAINVSGEECDKIEISGQTFTINMTDIADTLERVIEDEHALKEILSIVERPLNFYHRGTSIPMEDVASLGPLQVWVDPIDGTAAYLNGKDAEQELENGSLPETVENATVLVGMFDELTGRPIFGVVGHPLVGYASSTKFSEIYLCAGADPSILEHFDVPAHPKKRFPNGSPSKIRVITSKSEELELPDDKFDLYAANGAGYKLLMVILGHMDLYVLSKSSTYQWDTCAPHAVLRSLGGGLVDYRAITSFAREVGHDSQEKLLDTIMSGKFELKYKPKNKCSKETQPYQNDGGIIAFQDPVKLCNFLVNAIL